MLFWVAAAGALIGWAAADLAAFGMVAGGLLGLIFGWGIRRSIRAEVQAEVRAEVRAAVAQLDALPAGSAAASIPERAIAAAARLVPAPPRPDPPSTPTDDFAEPAAFAPNPPAAPGIIEQAFAAARGWVFGGNTIVRAGLAVLFV
ncbi:MAG: rane-like protein, partial [Sphingomonas bacterium]|nr:rane-like protein [Sphingomonas bacterium]